MISKRSTLQTALISFLLLAMMGGMCSTACAQSGAAPAQNAFRNAADFGFSPQADGLQNAQALQKAVDQTGTIVVSEPGTYDLAATVYVGSNTTLVFGNNVFIRKVGTQGGFSHVLLNKGALTKTFDHNIVIDGLHIVVNGVDKVYDEIVGLRGQLAFFYAKDVRINRFRCYDLGAAQFCIQVCTFEDLIIDDVVIEGRKDGIHLGRGKRFTIRNGVFATGDDAIALNGHDYASSNPEVGWIENGVIENCSDKNEESVGGFFCRLLAGSWIDWKPGMQVQPSDIVISNGRLYRVLSGKSASNTAPTHEQGVVAHDGLKWLMVQDEAIYSAGVRNVVFRDIVLEKPRTAFSIHYDGNVSRSYYPGAKAIPQEQLYFDRVRVAHDKSTELIGVKSPVKDIVITDCSLAHNQLIFKRNKDETLDDYMKTLVYVSGCTFTHPDPMSFITNRVDGKVVHLQMSDNLVLGDDFHLMVTPGNGTITWDSDIPIEKR